MAPRFTELNLGTHHGIVVLNAPESVAAALAAPAGGTRASVVRARNVKFVPAQQ